MQFRILAASSSLSRRLWYRNELGRRGCVVETAEDGLGCIQCAASFRPEILILEPVLQWGGCDGVLEVREELPSLMSVPVMVVDSGRNASQTYRISAYELAGYWKWTPTAEELMKAFQIALQGNPQLCPH